jgi:hypothetical protein
MRRVSVGPLSRADLKLESILNRRFLVVPNTIEETEIKIPLVKDKMILINLMLLHG